MNISCLALPRLILEAFLKLGLYRRSVLLLCSSRGRDPSFPDAKFRFRKLNLDIPDATCFVHIIYDFLRSRSWSLQFVGLLKYY